MKNHLLLLLFIFTLSAVSAQNISEYKNQDQDSSIKLELRKDHTFSLSISVSDTDAQAHKASYGGKWVTKAEDYVFTFTKQVPSFEVLFNDSYTPKGAIKILNNNSFAFNKRKSYVLIWGKLCKHTH